MEDIKKKVEAVLFTTGKFLTIEELAKACDIGSIGIVKDTINDLKRDYEVKDSSLILEEKDNKFKLNIKKEYQHLTSKLLSETEFNKPIQETLAIIAYKQPILQAKVIQIRGNKAYDHIKELKEHKLITAEKSGRTKLLKLTPYFYDYFDILEESLKEKFKEIKTDDKLDKQLEQAKQKLETVKKEAEEAKKETQNV